MPEWRVVLRRIETELAPGFATTRSRLPSALRSPIATEFAAEHARQDETPQRGCDLGGRALSGDVLGTPLPVFPIVLAMRAVPRQLEQAAQVDADARCRGRRGNGGAVTMSRSSAIGMYSGRR